MEKIHNSIKIWAIVVGVLSLSSLWTLSVYPIGSPVGIFSVVAILLGLAVAYAGIQLTTLSLDTINAIFWTKFIWLILNFVYSVTGKEVNFTRLLIIVAQGIIVWFLIQWAKKLPKK